MVMGKVPTNWKIVNMAIFKKARRRMWGTTGQSAGRLWRKFSWKPFPHT